MSNSKLITVTTIEETFDIAQKIIQLCDKKQQIVILLDGDLGAGKTTFTKGVAKALNICEKVKSPTFTIVKEYYSGNKDLYHFDAYRLEDTASYDIGIDEYLENSGVIVIEWSQYIQNYLPKEFLRVIITRENSVLDLEDTRRQIEIIATPKYEFVIDRL